MRRWWPDLLILVGIAWLTYACSAFAGDGSVEGNLDQGGGDLSGDFSVGYTLEERLSIVGGAMVTAIGVLAKINRRPRVEPPPPSSEAA